MKKLLILLLLVPMFIQAETKANADGSNIGGQASKSSTSTDSSCGAIYWGFNSAYDRLYGIRVSFYLEDGKKVGNSVDIFNWRSPLEASSWKKNLIGTVQEEIYYDDKLSFKKRKSIAEVRYSAGGQTKIDYVNGKSLNLRKDKNYVFYEDVIGKEYTSEKCNLRYYQRKISGEYLWDTGTETKNIKFDTPVGALDFASYSNRECFKEYFTLEETVKRYAKIAEAIDYVDVKSGEYKIIIEPIFILEGMCSDHAIYSTSGGWFTVSEIGKLLKDNKIRFNNINLKNVILNGLKLDQNVDFANHIFQVNGYTWKQPKNVNGVTIYLSWDQVEGKQLIGSGYGMAFINGVEVCKENCGNSKYKIVYRKIDLAHPFLNVDGTERELDSRSNWFGWNNERSEVSKVIDERIYEKEPEIVVTLTPSVIKEIRKYNDDSNNARYNQTTSETFKYFKQKFPSIFEFKN